MERLVWALMVGREKLLVVTTVFRMEKYPVYTAPSLSRFNWLAIWWSCVQVMPSLG
ncbi:hypothetical protein D3C76_1599490 [compost metagenome]